MKYALVNADTFKISQHTLEEIVKEALRRHLAQHGGNRTETARSLGVTKETVQNWLRRWKDVRREFPKIKKD